MKKALSAVLLLSGLLLYGCGVGGGTTASSDGGNSTSTPGGGSLPSFTVNLVDRAMSPATVDANSVRVVITRSELVPTPQIICDYDDIGDPIPGTCHSTIVSVLTVVYKDIQDVAYPGSGSFTIGIPGDNNVYDLDVITNYNNSILSYGSGTANPSNGSATIPMSTIGALLNLNFPDPVYSTQKFDVTLNNALPFEPRYTMAMSLASNPTISESKSTSSNKCTFTAPATYVQSDSIELLGTFTLDRRFLKANEKPIDWTRTFPDSSLGESVTSSIISLVSVTIN